MKDKSDVVTPSSVKAIYKQHIKMTSQAAVAHSSAKKGKKWRKKNKNYQKEKHPLAPCPTKPHNYQFWYTFGGKLRPTGGLKKDIRITNIQDGDKLTTE